MFREFSSRKKTQIGDNRLKNLRSTLHRFQNDYEIYQKELMFMLWAYDLEFWTLNHASEQYRYSHPKLANKIVYPLMKEGYIHKYFDKLTPHQEEVQMFHTEDKYSYRVRYALTQKARLMVQRFYSSLSQQYTQP
jgi:hypothetical protein